MEIYLDNCATTKVCDEGIAAAAAAMKTTYGNPSSLHPKGVEAEALLTETRKRLARLLHCAPEELYFTGSATESNNLSLFGAVGAYPRNGKTVVSSAVEHPSVENALKQLEKRGYRVKRVFPRKDGLCYPEDFLSQLTPDSVLLTIMLVNNEVGTVLPVAETITRAKKNFPKLLCHVDAVQGFSKIPFDLRKIPADLVSISGHKIYAPKGIGALFIRKGVRLAPLLFGGGQEKGVRPGTESVPLIAAFNEALKLIEENGNQYLEHYRACNQYLRERLQEVPEVIINSPVQCAPHVLNISVPLSGQKGTAQIFLEALGKKGIYISGGSACSKGELSHVLSAYGFSKERIRYALRISFSKDTTFEELDIFAETLKEEILRLKAVIK